MFGGARDSFVQRIFRDTKLIDSVFAMGISMYDRLPKTQEPASELEPLRAVQKLVHVCLQRLVEGDPESQAYFGRRVLPSTGEKWMQTILGQLEDPLGAAVTLSKLLGANEALMAQYANADLVLQFATMVRNLGPQPRLVNFFEAICTAGGNPIKSNQEMVLRLTWMNEEWRKKAFLSTMAVTGMAKKLPKLGDVVDPSGAVSAKHDSKAITAKAPADYIGKDIYESEEGLPAVFVQWSWSDNWQPGMDELFWAPSKLGLGYPVYELRGAPDKKKGGRSSWVRIEDLCWIQDPHRLCRAVTGKDYSEVLEDSKADPALAAALKAQSQLADYYVGELLMFAQMCFGRSYNVINHLSRQFSYEMLASICYNPHLPPRVRGASVSLVQNLYLDRFPQMHNCGRPVLPELLWVYSFSSGSKEAATAIKAMTLKDKGSLPEFGISPDHPLHGNENPFFGFPSGFKFFLLRNFGNKFLAGFGNGTLVSSQQHKNMMARTVMGLIETLTSFGFQSSLPKITDLLEFLIPVLDGRIDAEKLEGRSNYIQHQPLVKRFALSNTSIHVTGLKTNIIRVLMSISNFRANFRLRNLLQNFKEYNEDRRLRADLLTFHQLYVENKAPRFKEDDPLMLRIFKDFEALFVEGDGLKLQFEKLGNQIIAQHMCYCYCLCLNINTSFYLPWFLLFYTFTAIFYD